MKSDSLKVVMLCSLCLLYLFKTPAFALTDSIPRKAAGEKVVYLKLKLSSMAAVTVSKAPLKYNKHLALSFTLDDGYRSAFLTAYPLLHGGRISPPFPDEWKNDEGGDGSYSAGLFFSDGCAHAIPFRLGIAINAAGIGELPVNRGHLSWPEVHTLYQSGWDILNHGYHHATKHGTDYENEVLQNVSLVKNKLGFTMTQFIVPGGEGDKDYQKAYEQAALKNGSFSVASVNGAEPLIPVKDTVNLTSLIYKRDFMSSGNIPLATAKQRLSLLDSLMRLTEPAWLHEFTHGVGNSNLWSLSVVFPEFKYYMTTIAGKYGQKGTDKLWMAPWQEVYEYIWLRDRVKIETTQKGQELIIKMILPEIPDTFRHTAISLNIQTTSSFDLISQSSNLSVSYHGKGDKKLININL
ncbi:polysaccharide deacetylase family protein [Pedobacter sp. L105]|uniref:polysaccharide deacetylase family protein n=1 Tax=Pedobacter sp. L105 TaxID=1641871 RepID=UPI00131C030D|nr:polysaccharide deacetylase family protein [Pedobacter sp. L105]